MPEVSEKTLGSKQRQTSQSELVSLFQEELRGRSPDLPRPNRRASD